MKLCDPTINLIGQHSVCYTGYEWIPAVIGAIGAVAGAATSVIGGAQQAQAAQAAAAAQAQQAENARAIAVYNAQIQRQNADVSYQLAVYQAQANEQIAMFNQAAALNNAAYAQAQAIGAQRAYEQGLENAKQLEFQAEAARREGEEDSRRKREENAAALSQIRARFAASGVTQEGSPLVVLADAARLAESAVQDIAYATELESRKQLRASEIEEFEASSSLLDKFGFEVQAANAQLEANRFAYERDLAKYDSAIAGVMKIIDYKEADLVELAGESQAYGYLAEAQQSSMKASASMIQGIGGGIASGASGLSSAYMNYGYATGNIPLKTTTTGVKG